MDTRPAGLRPVGRNFRASLRCGLTCLNPVCGALTRPTRFEGPSKRQEGGLQRARRPAHAERPANPLCARRLGVPGGSPARSSARVQLSTSLPTGSSSAKSRPLASGRLAQVLGDGLCRREPSEPGILDQLDRDLAQVHVRDQGVSEPGLELSERCVDPTVRRERHCGCTVDLQSDRGRTQHVQPAASRSKAVTSFRRAQAAVTPSLGAAGRALGRLVCHPQGSSKQPRGWKAPQVHPRSSSLSGVDPARGHRCAPR